MRESADGAAVDEGPRRYLIAAAVSRYPMCADWDRHGLVQAREQIVELFTQKFDYRHHPAPGLDPTRAQLTDQLRAFCISDDRREDDMVVVYLSGHGDVLDDDGGHVLLMADTDPADVAYTSLPTADLVRVFRGTRVRRLLLILDTCYSGQGGNELAAAALERIGAHWGRSTSSPGLVVVSSAQPHQQAKAGLFPHLLSQAVNNQATAGHAPTHLSVSAVVQQMNNHADRPGYQRISLSLLGLTGEPPAFLTNPRHNVRLTDVDLALQDTAEFDAHALRRETEFTSRLLVRAMGYHGDATHGWWFCGRHRVLSELVAWLNQDDQRTQESPFPGDVTVGNVRVVTAAPGSGKTAVLGLLAALSMPERRRTVPVDALGLERDWLPGEDSIDVVMYAQNLSDSEVLSGLAAAAGFKCATVGEFLETLEQHTAGQGRPFTVLIDALDEAASPDTLCSQIVRPLIEHSRGRIRLLLGTRPHLLDRLGISHHPTHHDGVVIDLDTPRYADREALLAYTMRNLLLSRSTSPYRSTEPLLLQHVAQAVADAAGTSFLVARVAAYTLASADSVVTNAHSPRWRASLPRHAGQAMSEDLTRRLGPDAQRATDLLRPLAYAEGLGLPWEDIWAPLASALSGRTYTDADLLWLRHNAGAYVVEATEHGRSAYRLYHQALNEHLRKDTDAAAVQTTFVDTLTNCVPYRSDGTRDWSRAHPYTLHHLASHAAAAGRIDDILNATGYLVHAVPHSLAPYLDHAESGQARLIAAVYRTDFDLHATAAPSVRCEVLALNAARAGTASLLDQFNRHAPPGEWVPEWATGNDFTPAMRHTLIVPEGPVHVVACTVLDGRPVALAGTGVFNGVDGTVYAWDLATGRQIGRPLNGRSGPVFSLTCTVLDGWPVALAGTKSGAVCVWDLTSGRQLGAPVPHAGRVHALACTLLDSRPVVLSGTGIGIDGGNDDALYVWDLATRCQIGEPLQHPAAVNAVACTVLDGRPVALTSASSDINDEYIDAVYVWDLTTLRHLGEPLTGHSDRNLTALACTDLDGRPVVLVGTENGAVHVWDLATRNQIGEPLQHPAAVHAVACTVLDGRPVALVGTGNGAVHVWDLATRNQIAEPLPHLGGIYGVECALIDGRPIAVTDDGTLRTWDLMDSDLSKMPNKAPSAATTSMACTVLSGRPIAVTCTKDEYGDGEVHVWDLATGRQSGRSLRHHAPVSAMACTVLDGLPVVLTGTGKNIFDELDNAVYVWDLATGREIGRPLLGQTGPVEALACTVLDGRPIALAGTYIAGDIALADFADGAVHVWDLATGREIGRPLTGQSGPVEALACTVLDSRPIALVGDGTALEDGAVHLWDLATGRQIGQLLTGRRGSVDALACTVLDGRPIALVGTHADRKEGSARLWDLATRREIGQLLAGQPYAVRDMACTVLNGRPLAVISTYESEVYVWDLRTRKVLQYFIAAGSKAARFSPDGRLIVSMGRDLAVFHRPADQPGTRPGLLWR